MIDRKAAQEAMRGFSGMPGLPNSQEALKARVDAMRNNARTIGHAQRVVEKLKEQETSYPSVQAIVECCQQTPDDDTMHQASRECPYCHGELWITIYGEYGISGAWRCTHNGPPPATVGVKIAPAVARHYAAEGRG